MGAAYTETIRETGMDRPSLLEKGSGLLSLPGRNEQFRGQTAAVRLWVEQ
jgi:hypothetical protein